MANSNIPLHLISGREIVEERGGRDPQGGMEGGEREGERRREGGRGREGGGGREEGREACQQAGFVIANFLSDTLQLHEVCLSLIQAYAKSSAGKYSRLSLEEEEQCEDLLLFMKMMAHLTIKDCLDLGG